MVSSISNLYWIVPTISSILIDTIVIIVTIKLHNKKMELFNKYINKSKTSKLIIVGSTKRPEESKKFNKVRRPMKAWIKILIIILITISLAFLTGYIIFNSMFSRSLIIEDNKFVSPYLEFSIEFPNNSWEIDAIWSRPDWMIFSKYFREQCLILTVIRLEDSVSKNAEEASENFEYEMIEGIEVKRTGSREESNIDGKKVEVIEFESGYNRDLGYSYEYGFGKSFFFLNEKEERTDEYQIICVGLGQTKEDAKNIFIEYTPEFEYALENFILTNK